MAATLEIHLEWWYHAVLPQEQWEPYRACPDGHQVVQWLFKYLSAYHVKATWFVLGTLIKENPNLLIQIIQAGHRVGSHGWSHQHGEHEGDKSDQQTRFFLIECAGYRSPFWDKTRRPGWCGGVFFRTLPYQWLKAEIQRTKCLYVHPHDFYPTAGLFRRRLFFCNPWERFEQLLQEVSFERT